MTSSPQRIPPPPREPGRRPETVLEVEIRRGRFRSLVVVTGELDLSGAPLVAAVVEYVDAAEGPPIAVDLSGVSFADTHGLAPVLDTGVVITAASPTVRRLLDGLGSPPPRGRRVPAARQPAPDGLRPLRGDLTTASCRNPESGRDQGRRAGTGCPPHRAVNVPHTGPRKS